MSTSGELYYNQANTLRLINPNGKGQVSIRHGYEGYYHLKLLDKLIYQAFNGDIPSKCHLIHYDELKDNSLSNLVCIGAATVNNYHRNGIF